MRGEKLVELIKESVSGLLDRVKSPILFSIFLTFLAVNWRPIWFIVWGDGSAINRLEFFDANTSNMSLYVIPIVLGFLIGILGPWLRWIGSYTAKAPTKWYKSIENDQASELKIESIRWLIKEQEERRLLQAALEKTQIAAAKAEEARAKAEAAENERLIKSKEQNGKLEGVSHGAASLKVEGAAQSEEMLKKQEPLSKQEIEVLQKIASQKEGTYRVTEASNNYHLYLGSRPHPIDLQNRREYLRVLEALKSMHLRGLLSGRLDDGKLTLEGYNALESEFV